MAVPLGLVLMSMPLNVVGCFFRLVRGLYIKVAYSLSSSSMNVVEPNSNKSSTCSSIRPSSSSLFLLIKTHGSTFAQSMFIESR